MQPLRWKARWWQQLGANEIYDVRARQWSPELGSFLSVDEYAFHDRKSTLWGWPNQNPVRWRDPSGRLAEEAGLVVFLAANPEVLPVLIVATAAVIVLADVLDYLNPEISHGANASCSAGGAAPPLPSASGAGSESPSPAPQVAAGGAGMRGGGRGTRLGVNRNNPRDWREWRDTWDSIGEQEILSAENRNLIANSQNPVVDAAWIAAFPGHAEFLGEPIIIHHIAGSPITVPLPRPVHHNAHMPGGFRYNPGGPGDAY